SWFKNMWRRFEQNAICRPKNEKQFQVACPEGQPLDRGTQIRPALGKPYFLYRELKLDQLDQFSFSPPVPGQKLHEELVTCTERDVLVSAVRRSHAGRLGR